MQWGMRARSVQWQMKLTHENWNAFASYIIRVRLKDAYNLTI